MPLRQREDTFNLFLKVQNLIRFGRVKDLDLEKNTVLVHFSEECELWLTSLCLKSGLGFPFEKEETVLVLCPDGELSEGVVWGSIPKGKTKEGFTVETDKAARIEAKAGLLLGNGKEDLIDLFIQALKIIAQSKTSTLMGLQPSIESGLKLPVIVKKLESLHAQRN